MAVMDQRLVDAITDRLMREPDWAKSELGETLALIVDTAVVSLPILSDYTGIRERSIYRWIKSQSGQPRIPKDRIMEQKIFDESMQEFRTALQAAVDDDAFKDLHDNWFGQQDFKGRDEALRILLSYKPVPTPPPKQ